MSGRGRAVVVTHNSASTIERCLASLAAQEGCAFDLAIVDNASTDDTCARVRAAHPGARLIASPDNLGFGAANNLVLADPEPEWFALVNPDAFVPPTAFRACTEALDLRPDVGAVGLRHVDEQGRDQPSAFRFLDLRGLLAEAVGLDRLLGTGFHAGGRRGQPAGAGADVDWLQGSFLFVRGAALRRVGGFDPRIFMYGEDMEWCYRARRAGFAMHYLAAPVIVHIGGVSAGGRLPSLYVEHWKGRMLFFDLHRGPVARLLARAIAALSIGLRWAVYEAARFLPAAASRRPLFRAAMRWVLSGQPSPSARA